MKLTLKTINILAGIIQFLINAIVIIPETLNILATGKGGFGYGILMLGITLPLAYMVVFAFFGFFNYEHRFKRVKKLLIAAYILAIIVCILSFLQVPIVAFSLLGVPVFIVLTLKIKKENIGKRILLTNGIVLLCQLILLFMVFR